MASVDGSKSLQILSDESFQFHCNPCDYGGIKKGAVCYCPQCQEYLCETCKLAHQGMSVTRNHQVVSGNLMYPNNEYRRQEETQKPIQCSCGGKEITVYCKDHDEVFCDNCKAIKHRNCSTPTTEVASAEFETTATDSTKNKTRTLRKKLEELKQKRTHDAESLTNQTMECRAAVEKFKKKLIEQIEKITERSLEDIAKCDSEQRVNIDHHIRTCSAALIKLDIDYRPYEEAITLSQNPVIFIRNIQLKKTIAQIDRVLEEVDNEIKRPNISFHCDETLRMANVKSLGVVKSTPTLEATTSRTDRKQTCPVIADMDIKSVRKVSVKFPSDQTDPCISGSQFMPTGELVLCDYANSSIKVLNADFTQKELVKISSQPWDCCLMNPEEVVVSQLWAKSLLFVKVVPKLQIGSSVTLDQVCRGVAVKDDLIYVSFDNDNGEIRVLDRKGQQQINVFNTFRFQLPWYIFITETGVLYVSEFNGHNIRAIKDGKEVSDYKHVGLLYPTGLFIDGGENIIVCENSNNSLKLIDKTGQQKRDLLSNNDSLTYPRTVSFRSSDGTLIVGGGLGQGGLVVCKMNERETK